MRTKETKKILIIEDEKPMARALELKLTRNGFKTTTTLNGKLAIKALEREKFDFIICDLIMPKMDGFGVLEALKKKKIKSPVMVLTNLGQEDDEKRAKLLGVKDFFIKANTPIAKIVDRITELLQ